MSVAHCSEVCPENRETSIKCSQECTRECSQEFGCCQECSRECVSRGSFCGEQQEERPRGHTWDVPDSTPISCVALPRALKGALLNVPGTDGTYLAGRQMGRVTHGTDFWDAHQGVKAPKFFIALGCVFFFPTRQKGNPAEVRCENFLRFLCQRCREIWRGGGGFKLALRLFIMGMLCSLKSYFACSPENFCGFCSLNLPGNFALKNGGGFW